MAEWRSPARYVHGQEAIDRRLKFLTMDFLAAGDRAVAAVATENQPE